MRGPPASAFAADRFAPGFGSTCMSDAPKKPVVSSSDHERRVPPLVADAMFVKSSASMYEPAAAIVTGCDVEARVRMLLHVRCHSSSEHSVAPIDAQAATACGYVTLTHGCTPLRLHACAVTDPASEELASGLLIS